MTAKERVLDLISRLPDNATISDILSELFVQMQIEKGLQELDGGQGLDHEKMEKRLAKWRE